MGWQHNDVEKDSPGPALRHPPFYEGFHQSSMGTGFALGCQGHLSSPAYLVPVGDDCGLFNQALSGSQRRRNVRQLDSIDEGCGVPELALHFKTDDSSVASHLLSCYMVVRMAREAGVMYLQWCKTDLRLSWNRH